MEFVTAWKATSVVLTGAFGILGLLKEFKNKETGHVTKWGRVSLAGILLSSTLGVIAQFKESSRQEKSRQVTANQTLALAQKTDQAVREIQRVLHPLEYPRFQLRFGVSCDNPKYKTLCLAVKKGVLSSAGPGISTLGGRTNGIGRITDGIWVRFEFFADSKIAQKTLETFDELHGRSISDLSFDLPAYAEHGELWAGILTEKVSEPGAPLNVDENGVQIFFNYQSQPRDMTTNGRIQSLTDLPGTTMLISRIARSVDDVTFDLWNDEWKLLGFKLSLKNGQVMVIDGSRFERIAVNGDGDIIYRYVFP